MTPSGPEPAEFARFTKELGFELDEWQLELAEEALEVRAPIELRHGEATARALVEQWREAA